MTCEHLVCANCAGPVAEGRCPVCRASRDHVHTAPIVVTPTVIAALVALLAILAAVGYHLQ